MSFQPADLYISPGAQVFLPLGNEKPSTGLSDGAGEKVSIGAVYKLLGLQNIVRMFKFYGLRLDSQVDDVESGSKKSKNYPIIFLNYLALVFLCFLSVAILSSFVLYGMFNVNNLCLWLGVHTVRYLTFGLYTHMIWKFNHFSYHLRCFMAVVTRLYFGRRWPIFLNKIRSGAKIICLFTFAVAVLFSVIYTVCSEIDYRDDNDDHFIILRLEQILMVWWYIFVASLYIFMNFLFIFICLLLSFISDNCLTFEDDEAKESNIKKKSIAYHQHKHQTLVLLAQHADAMFSTFMMATLVHELLVIIVCVQMLQSQYFSLSFASSTVFNVFEVIAFVVKNLICSSLNDKLKSSLTLTKLPNSMQELENCSAEHINYILYLNEQLLNRPELTYGGFFPVKKTFIFTIAGTALTYALVLNGITDN